MQVTFLPNFSQLRISTQQQMGGKKKRVMQQQQQSSRTRQRHLRLAGDRREPYPHSLQFYQEPPTESISLVEFESFAVDRLRLLKVVENLGVSYVRSGDAYKTKLEAELRKLKFPYRALAEDDYDARRKDHISHFILRLAYCQSEELRRWFLQQEMDLFRYRFHELTDSLRQKFLDHVNLSFEANERIIEWLGLEGTPRIIKFQLLCHRQGRQPPTSFLYKCPVVCKCFKYSQCFIFLFKKQFEFHPLSTWYGEYNWLPKFCKYSCSTVVFSLQLASKVFSLFI
ncbi:DNA primase large subunit-like isoform X2 [Centrocercus urophasianus]|uniref:DNA primase large subunit-like isoform X2 n=1 Tax=Centrocercus urophasianus TaxID=9002 RepID=UPI001C652C3B|nr:DNA primase large subunit-like isoform X2 [Centrocercus urophasianus]